jgi:ribosomal protein S18 acetylase RimI-like enzyme
MRYSFADDPGLVGPLFDLLDEVFPGLRAGAAGLKRLGASWEEISTPYVRFEDGRPVSHVGVIELPLVVAGAPVMVSSVHAVATRPDRRRRGFYRELMHEVLEDREGRSETFVLSTENPEYYQPFGFRVVGEHQFEIERDGRPGTPSMRTLDLADGDDVAILRRLLATRRPVSRVVGVVGGSTVFLFNESRRPLRYFPDLDVVACFEHDDRTLALYDVVGPALPTLEHLLSATGLAVERVVLHFAPDRFAPEAVAVRRVFEHDGPSHLLVRGPFGAEDRPFTLPRSART